MTKSWKQALSKILQNAQRDFSGGYPHYTDPDTGTWVTLPPEQTGCLQGGKWTHGNWTAGFWPGILWLSYAYTKEEKFRKWALRSIEPLKARVRDNNTHDIGFLFYPSFVLGFELTSDQELKETALLAADILAGRFISEGKYLQAWGPSDDPNLMGSSTIDTMMNIPLLWWAYDQTGNEKYYNIAKVHAKTTLLNMIREDNSSIHLVMYKPESGQLIEEKTFQGYSNSSCWARGHSWAICGFTFAYEHTGDEEFYNAACVLSDYFIERLPNDHIPFWDFDDPAIPRSPKDSSAAAIGAYGMLKLGNLAGEYSAKYAKSAQYILTSLNNNYVDHDNLTEGIVNHGCYSNPHKEGVDSCLIFGDYFYLNALNQESPYIF